MAAPQTAREDATPAAEVAKLSALDRRLLDAFQRDFPITPHPYAELAKRLDIKRATIANLDVVRVDDD